MPPSSQRADQQVSPKKLRSACDECHQSKIRCTGGMPCETCRRLGIGCRVSKSNRQGRPKGTLNRKTLARIQGYKAHVSDEPQSLKTELMRTPVKRQISPTFEDQDIFLLGGARDQVVPPDRNDAYIGQSADFFQHSSAMQGYWFLADGCEQDINVTRNENKLNNTGEVVSKFRQSRAQDATPWSRMSETETNSTIAMLGCSSATIQSEVGDKPRSDSSCIACRCMSSFLELLDSMASQTSIQTPLPVDMVLIMTEHAVAKLERLLQCPCSQTLGADHLFETLSLAAICIRSITRIVGEVFQLSGSWPASPSTIDPSLQPPEPFPKIRHSIGAYRATSEETALVSYVLISRLLERLNRALGEVSGLLANILKGLEPSSDKSKWYDTDGTEQSDPFGSLQEFEHLYQIFDALRRRLKIIGEQADGKMG
ncbi:hypothetical protein MMC30_008390 [Trapelia coarctata]|nr:hypothetical protein [Trapelia coarctata]